MASKDKPRLHANIGPTDTGTGNSGGSALWERCELMQKEIHRIMCDIQQASSTDLQYLGDRLHIQQASDSKDIFTLKVCKFKGCQTTEKQKVNELI